MGELYDDDYDDDDYLGVLPAMFNWRLPTSPVRPPTSPVCSGALNSTHSFTPVCWLRSTGLLFPAPGRVTATAVSPSPDRVCGTVFLLNSDHQTLGWTCSDTNWRHF